MATLEARAFFPAEVALDAARACHLAGAVPEAVAWYRTGLSRSGAAARPVEELASGLVLALGELGRWDEALLELDRIEGTHPELGLDTSPERRFILLHRNGRLDAAALREDAARLLAEAAR